VERELSILVLALGCTVCYEGALAVRERLLMGVYRVTGITQRSEQFFHVSLHGRARLCRGGDLDAAKFVRWFSVVVIAAAVLSIVLSCRARHSDFASSCWARRRSAFPGGSRLKKFAAVVLMESTAAAITTTENHRTNFGSVEVAAATKTGATVQRYMEKLFSDR